jgi:hypothetical protein
VNFWKALFDLLFGDKGQLTGYQGPTILAFALACSMMALIAVLLDRVIFEVRAKSIFNLAYGNRVRDTVRLLLLWSLGAGLGGLLGAASNVVQLTRFAAVTVGVGWPLILPRLIDSLAKKEDDQEPVQR